MQEEPCQGEGTTQQSALREPERAEWGCGLHRRAALSLHQEGVLSRGPSGGSGVQQRGRKHPAAPGSGWRSGPQPSCACCHQGTGVLAAPGGEGHYQRLESRGKAVAEVVAAAEPCQLPVPCRSCGQGCKRSRGDRGGLSDHGIL